MTRRYSRFRIAVSLATVSATLAAGVGCSVSRSKVNEDQILRSAGLGAGERPPGASRGDERDSSLDARIVTPEAPADIRVLVGSPDAPRIASGDADEIGAAIPREIVDEGPPRLPSSLADSGFIDAVVGQINGRPVYASGFLAPMDARLRADAARLPPDQWRQQAQGLIEAAVFDRMKEELVLAEFQAQLTPETKQGLLSFVDQLRREIVAQNLGSESLAGRRLEESEGLSLDEKVKQERDRQIILAQMRRAIGPRVYVSWREVELAYEREYDRYNPAQIARLRMIQVNDEESAAAVRAELADGEPFEEVARRHSDFRADEGGLWTIEVESGGYTETRIFAPEELNEVALSLDEGEVSEPFEWSGSTIWLTLEAIEQPDGQSLYDVQVEIHNRLQNARYAEEEREYLVRLFGRASVTDLREMAQRLFTIAEERYLDSPRTDGARRGG